MAAFGFVFVLIGIVRWTTARRDCAAAGGVLVGDAAGLGWECVEPKR